MWFSDLVGWSSLTAEDEDEAIRLLDRAYEERSAGLIYLHLDPMYDSLRDDPRMDAMIERIGLQ